MLLRETSHGSERPTQHSLRHTCISLRVAIGDDSAAISRGAGHADAGVTFRIHAMALPNGHREQPAGRSASC